MSKKFSPDKAPFGDTLAEARRRLDEEAKISSGDTANLPERPATNERISSLKDFENGPEKDYDFTRESIAELLSAGATDDEIWEQAKQAGVFFKANGSSFYLSKVNESDPDKSTWRRRSVTGNTSGSLRQSKVNKLIHEALDDYRTLGKDYPSYSDAFRAADYIAANGETRVTMNKHRSVAKYWDEIAAADDSTAARPEEANAEASEKTPEVEKSSENDADDNMAPKPPVKETSAAADSSTTDSENLENEPENTENTAENIRPDLTVGDLVHRVTRTGEHRWQRPKRIEKIITDDEESVAKFSDGSFAPAAELEVVSADMLEQILERIPEDVSTEDFLAQIENLSPQESENLGWSMATVGYKTEQLKGRVMSKAFGKISDKFSSDEGALSRWFTALKDNFDKKQSVAEENLQEMRQQHNDEDSGLWQKIKGQAKDKWQLSKNVLKTWGAIVSPRRQLMIAGLITATGAEAAKEARFANINMMEDTRVKNHDDAAREAWAIHKAAQKKSSGLSGKRASVAAIHQAYRESIPKDLLKRLDNRITDPGEAHKEALELRNAAEQMPDSDYISTEKLRKAFEKMFDDPQPGQNTGFIASMFENHITELAQKVDTWFHKIDANDSIGEEEKTARKNKILNRFGRLGAFEDYDRMITQAGQIDSWALAARNTEKVGKGVVGAMMAISLAEITSSISSLFSTDNLDPEKISDITSQDPEDPLSNLPGSGQPENPFSPLADSASTPADTASKVENPFVMPKNVDSTAADSLVAPTDTATVEGGQTATEASQAATETISSLHEQLFEIDEDGEGMIGAIAQKLEGDFNLSHEKAMEIGNKLFTKGELAPEGSGDELFNLVGKGDTFTLDFGDLKPEDLENYSTDELAQIIDFDQDNFVDAPGAPTSAEELPNRFSGMKNPIERVRELEAAAVSGAGETAEVANLSPGVDAAVAPNAAPFSEVDTSNQTFSTASAIPEPPASETVVALGDISAADQPVETPNLSQTAAADQAVSAADVAEMSESERERFREALAQANQHVDVATPETTASDSSSIDSQPESESAPAADAAAAGSTVEETPPEGVSTRPYENPDGAAATDESVGAATEQPPAAAGDEMPEGVSTRPYQEVAASTNLEQINAVGSAEVESLFDGIVGADLEAILDDQTVPVSDIFIARNVFDHYLVGQSMNLSEALVAAVEGGDQASVVVFERLLTAVSENEILADRVPQISSTEVAEMLSYTRERVAQLSSADFPGTIETYVQESLAASRQ